MSSMLKKAYYWFHKRTSKAGERGEYSAGRWQDMVRSQVLGLMAGGKGNIIDVGCGEGLLLAKLAQEAPSASIYGIDIWEEILEKARIRLRDNNITKVTVSCADASSIPYEDDFFDTVICINVFFNLPSDEVFYKSLGELIRICTPQGKIIFDIRNSANVLLWIKYKLARYYDDTVKDLPLRTYSLKKVLLYLEKHRVKVNQIVSVGFPRGRFAPISVIEAQKQ